MTVGETLDHLVGRPAPDFDLPDQHLTRVRLADVRRRGHVLLVFFPFAFTPVCAGELTAHQQHLDDSHPHPLLLAISCDAPATQRAFAEEQRLTFPVLSDFWPHGEVARSYDVFDPALGVARRGSVLIDPGGIIRWTTLSPYGTPRDPLGYRAALVGR